MFTGSMVALVTPMTSDDQIDYASLSDLIDWHLQEGTDALVILGTTGEVATITDEERPIIIRKVIDQVNRKIPVIVGTGKNATARSITLTKQAMQLGADAALLVVPYYNRPTQEGLLQHFSAIARTVPLPQIVYNVPSRTGTDLLPETFFRLTHISNIVGIKEAVGDLERMKALSAVCDEIDLYSGNDEAGMRFILEHGAKGIISVVANIQPKMSHLLCQAALKRDRPLAETYNQALAPWYKALYLETNPAPSKWLLSQMGKIATNTLRLPLVSLSEQYYDEIKDIISQPNIAC